ncbi:MAG: hypothetical protein ACLS4C_00815 [Faecalibacterium sp.]
MPAMPRPVPTPCWRQKKSRRAAAQNLRQKGLAAGEIQQALDAVYTPDVSGEDPELEAAAALVEGHYRKKAGSGPQGSGHCGPAAAGIFVFRH